MDSNYVLVDGGSPSMPRLIPQPYSSLRKELKVISIRDDDLRVVNDHFFNGSTGVIHCSSGVCPTKSTGFLFKLSRDISFLVVPQEG